MENNVTATDATYDELYNYAVKMSLYGNKNSYEIKNALLERGMNEQDADVIIENIEGQITDARRKKAQKDMLYGALWCIGGTALTLANIGYIFWGAIIFGGIQFFRGVSNLK
ncbi:hypothetical protein ACFGVR_17695 [Mucilaginibacter sp. AW1-3]